MSLEYYEPTEHRTYKEILARALHEHSTLATREENEPDTDINDLFTDNKQVRTLEKPDWHILYGRRGTGKTTLLHKLADVIDKKDSYATLTISLQKCLVDLPSGTPDLIRGLVQFEKFIMEIGFLLYRIYANRTAWKNKNRKLTKLLNYFNSEHRLIEASILNIATFAHRGTVYGALIDKTKTISKKRERRTSWGIGSKFDLSMLKGAEQFSAYANAEIKKNLENIQQENYKETAYIDFADLKRDFIELLDALHIKTLFILIDEWSALDRRAHPMCQVHFAEFLKRAFFGTSRICLKISAIEHESKFEDTFEEGRIGLEVGADIFVQVNLDQIYNDRVINLKEFFEELIYRRLRHCERGIDVFRGRTNHDRPIESFLGLIFESKNGFDELIKGSGGIPRDFINRFDAVAAAYNYSIDKTWKEHRIREVIIRHSIGRVQDHVQEDRFLSCIFDKISEIVSANHNRVFLVPKLSDAKLTWAIDSLFSDRLIHGQDLVVVPDRIRSKYGAYFIDYGIFLDRIRSSKHQAKEAEVAWPLHDDASVGDIEKFVINVRGCQIGI